MDECDKLCENCKKSVSAANYSLHSAHCHRNIGLCKVCNEPYPKNEIESHMLEAHTKKACDKCGQEFERQSEDKHMTEECTKRLVKCHICEIDVQECELQDHVDYCGSRTELCNECNCYVMLKFKDIHLSSNHAFRSMEDATSGKKVHFAHVNLVSDGRATTSQPAGTSSEFPDRLLSDLEYAHGYAFEDLLPEPESPPSFTNDFNHLLNIDGQRRRHPRIPILDPFAQEETSNLYRLTNATARPPKTVDEDIRIPCEVCEELIEPILLMDHQETCRDNVEGNNLLTRNNFFSRSFSSGSSDESRPVHDHMPLKRDATLIPCEYCYKPFDADIIIEHQSGCTMAENVLVNDRGLIVSKSPPVNPFLPQEPLEGDYLDDLFLKEAIEISLKEGALNEIPSPQNRTYDRTLNPNAATFLPKIRNVPIRIEGSPRASTANRQRMELEQSEIDIPSPEQRDARPKRENSASNSPPKPPTRRRAHKE